MIEYFYASLLNFNINPFIIIDERKINWCKMLIWYRNNSKKREASLF